MTIQRFPSEVHPPLPTPWSPHPYPLLPFPPPSRLSPPCSLFIHIHFLSLSYHSPLFTPPLPTPPHPYFFITQYHIVNSFVLTMRSPWQIILSFDRQLMNHNQKTICIKLFHHPRSEEDVANLPRYHPRFAATLFQWSHAHCQHFLLQFYSCTPLSIMWFFVQFCAATGWNYCMFHHLHDSALV